jgi:acetyl-CoA synthetase
VLHAHRALIGRLPAAENWFHFTGDDRILHSGKFNWTYVLGTAMMDPLYHGKTVIVYEGENSPEKWLSLIKEFGCNIFIGVPTIFRQILQKTKAAKGCRSCLRSNTACARASTSPTKS